MFAAVDTSRRLPFLMRAGCALVVVTVAFGSSVPRELPLLPGGRAEHAGCERAVQDGTDASWTRGELEPVPGPELLPSSWARPPEGLAGFGRVSPLEGRHLITLVPVREGLRDVAVQHALSRQSQPAPAMHLSAAARVVLVPAQGPPRA